MEREREREMRRMMVMMTAAEIVDVDMMDVGSSADGRERRNRVL
jgi:hypothetical protein